MMDPDETLKTTNEETKSATDETEETIAWFEQLQTNGCAIIHKQSLVYSTIATVYRPGEYVSPHNGKPVDATVVEFDGEEPRHCFVATKDAFLVMTKRDAGFAKIATELAMKLVGALGVLAKKHSTGDDLATLIVTSIFRGIANGLTAHPPAEPAKPEAWG